MSQDQIDYAAVLEDLKKRREKLDAAIAAIALILGDPGVATSATSSLNGEDITSGSAIRSDAFFNMSVPDAVRKYLRMTKRPQRTGVIATALKDGGILSQSKNFYANVFTALMRDPDFVKVKKEWGLAEWYPRGVPKKEGKASADDQVEEADD